MTKLVELLRPSRRPGYPTGYLLARLPSRRAEQLATCPDGNVGEARRELARELAWLCSQLEPSLYRQLAPVLVFLELPRLLTALRFREAGDRAGVTETLADSILHPRFAQILSQDRSYGECVEELIKWLSPRVSGMGRLVREARKTGRAELEQSLADTLLAAGLKERPAGPVHDFLARQALRRRLLGEAKADYWNLKKPGNHIRPPGWRRRRLHLAQSHPGILADPAALEHQQLTEIANEWRRRRRSDSAVEKILDYLWTCYLATRGCGIRGLAELLGEERVAAEVIL